MADKVTFARPPVREVSLTIWFDRLRTLSALHLAEIRIEWADSFPHVEEVAPYAPWTIDDDGFSFVDLQAKWPMPACLFSSKNRDRRTIIQDDRFTLSWRFTKEGDYPGFDILHDELMGRYARFVSSISQSGNPEPIVRRVTVEYENYLTGADSQDVAVAVLCGQVIKFEPPRHERDSISFRKHYCPSQSNDEVTLLLAVDAAESEFVTSDAPGDDVTQVTRLAINGRAQVEKDQNPADRLTQAHDAALELFLSLFGEDTKVTWRESDGQTSS